MPFRTLAATRLLPVRKRACPMTGPSHVVQLALWSETDWPPKRPEKRPSLHTSWRERAALPRFVRDCPVAMRSLDLLGPLDWDTAG